MNAAALLYLLLATDVLNGSWTLAAGEPATAAALAVKAAIVLALMTRVAWTGAVAAAVVVPLACAAFYLGLRPDALLASNLDANLWFAKAAGTTLLMALVASSLGGLSEPAVATFVRTALLVVAASLALGLAGVGHDRYDDDQAFLAANGFLAAGNEMNLVLVAVFWWLSDRIDRGAATRWDRRLYWLTLALMVISSSKTTIASALLIGLWFHRRRPWHLAGIALMLVAGFVFIVNTGIWERWIWGFQMRFEEGVMSGLTSGRFGRAADSLAEWQVLPPEGSAFMAVNGLVESDPLDLLLNFGWAGIAMGACFGFVLWRTAGGRWLPFALVAAASVFAGHVAVSTFAAPLLACALAPARRAQVRRSTSTMRSAARPSPNGSAVRAIRP